MKQLSFLRYTPIRGLPALLFRLQWFIALITLALFVSAGSAQTATPAKVSGVVRDPTGALIPGATVQITRAGGGVVASATTDDGGHFQMAQPAGGDYDLIVAMYHDQGHGPVKVLGIEAGTNITVGLPVIRTSVDHGTAFDIAGTGRVDPRSMIEALRQAVELSRAG